MPFLIFKEKNGFIQGRNIKDCLCLAFEVANLLDKKTRGGNLDLKVDITKDYDTLNWKFIIKVLKRYGFKFVFYH